MKLFRNLRLRWLNYVLKQQLSKKNVKHNSLPFDKVKKVGILFDIRKEEDLVFIKNYVQLLKKSGKTVELLTFVDSDKPHEAATDEFYTVFNQKSLTWYGLPEGEAVTTFSQTPFDLLLGLHTAVVLPLNCIAAQSHAKFRVGAYHDLDLDCYDLMIDNSPNNTLQHLIRQIDQHLRIMS
jgi:hypothetical protein